MATRRSTDDKLDELEAAVASADAESLPAVLSRGLSDKHYRIVALAAHYAVDRLVYACVPDLLEAYPRFLANPVKRDPNCLAKKAIVRALYELDCDAADFYRTAIRYRQMEPVWGGTVDTATDLRTSAAMGLVASGYHRALVEVAELLIDSEPPVRAGAARAIACGNPREAELLLRAKVLAGDDEALVIGDCFAGLLAVEPDESVAFVGRFLARDDAAVAEAAALALGESRLPAALDALQTVWQEVYVPADLRRVLVRAAALHRSDASFDWLVTIVAEADTRIATETIDVLSIYRHNDRLSTRLKQALGQRSDREPESLFAELWA
jgi:HEAT repeat protein